MTSRAIIFTMMMAFSVGASATNGIGDALASSLPPGNYQGVTTQGERCHVGVQYLSIGTYTVTVTPQSFNFDTDSGSSQCMYSKACFSVQQGYEVLNYDKTNLVLEASVKRPSGGPDNAAAKRMSLSMKIRGDQLLVRVQESIGLFGLSSTQAECTLKAPQ